MPEFLSISLSEQPPQTAQALIFYADESGPLGPVGGAIWARTGLDFARIAKATGFSGRPGHMIDIAAPAGLDCERLVVLGRGDDGQAQTEAAWADRGGSLFAKLDGARIRDAAVILDEPGISPRQVAALAAGATLRSYRFDKYIKRGSGRDHDRLSLTIAAGSPKDIGAELDQALAVAAGTILARDLVNEPANLLGPEEMAQVAQGLSEIGVSVEVLTEKEMQKLGMGALLAVGQGSVRPPRLVVMQWNGGKKQQDPVAFVGKGIVFDTGGISIKGAASMENMKGDMAGAAAITGLMQALASRKAKVNAIGILALAENMPDGNAFRPGDIITAMSGETIEIISTDAEGRLVLADALWYCRERFKPQAMVDIATLTGAILVALGNDYAGVFTNTDSLAAGLQHAGLATGEKVWHLPIGHAYDKLIESRFADIKNQGGRNGGASIAAQFLSHFVGEVPWAHVDIAGTGFGVPSSETNSSWGTGFGVALFDRFIRDNYEG
ncbi:leucyl aminopeptidase [Pelagibacterium sp. H642]|uniref:leucyl aminopeptidase n=1 Tax=Pelagibacterium sp. H642 TaxID=1881069 RepID=UPI002815724C|nr:leucyl aminopeptidase [Pelagibacterium sp. H642]WMT90913.1 leucyl aminopeptidase [Pelagibacterium sp. H642]